MSSWFVMLVEAQRYFKILLRLTRIHSNCLHSRQDLSILRVTNTQGQALSLEQLDVVFGMSKNTSTKRMALILL